MRIALITDALGTPTRGNCTTVQRWLDHTQPEVEVVTVPADPHRELDPVPDVIHGYHARLGGIAALQLARRYHRPLVVSIGGTDLYELVTGQDQDGEVEAVFRAARCITGAFESFREVVSACLGNGVPYVVVPRGISIPDPPRPRPRRPDGTLRVLLPAGLRPVKDLLLAIELGEELVARGLPLQLNILGSALDQEYAARVQASAVKADFVHLGQVPHERMAEAYRDADVVWNTSVHEGGANALLEAVAEGCALFVRDAPGNRELFIGDQPPGTLFRPDDLEGAEAFHRQILLETADERRARTALGIQWLRAHHDPEVEALALKAAWRRALL
jgi:glycosyltransferase involved in cell wall biosynthesis